MTLDEKLLNTYGFDVEPILDALKANTNIKWRLEETDDYACILWESTEGLLQGDTPGVYVAYDDMFEPQQLRLVMQQVADKLGLSVVENVTPIAKYERHTEFTNWQKTVKTAPSYWRGEKFKTQHIQRREHDLSDLEQSLDMQYLLKVKQDAYPESTADTMMASFKIAAKMQPDYPIYLLTSHVKDELIWGGAFCKLRDEWVCPFVSVTPDQDLQRVYKPMLVAHMEVVKTCRDLDASRDINFGLYFGYKELLCLEKTWLPGIR